MTGSHQGAPGSRASTHTLAERLSGKMPWLLAIWLFLAVLGPHQEVYKVFFHAVVIPSLLVLLFAGQLSRLASDPLLKVALVFFVYAGVSTFIIGLGPLENHFRALRWCVEAAFLLLALWVWMPSVMANRVSWGRYFVWLSLLGAAAGIVQFAFFEDLAGRLTGLGGLHNPIHTAAVLLVLFAMGHLALTSEGYPGGLRDRALVVVAFAVVCAAVLMSESRAPIGAMVVYFVFLAILGLFVRPNWREILTYTGALLLVIMVVASLYGLDRFADQLAARGMSYRLDIWKGYLIYPPESWWLGFGLGTEADYVPAAQQYWQQRGVPAMHPHSVYVGTLVETGIIGAVFLVSMGLLVLRKTVFGSERPSDRFRLLGILGLVLLLTLTASQGVISSAKMLWLYFWLPVSFVWFWSNSVNKGLS